MMRKTNTQIKSYVSKGQLKYPFPVKKNRKASIKPDMGLASMMVLYIPFPILLRGKKTGETNMSS